jgi:hypothetical protein
MIDKRLASTEEKETALIVAQNLIKTNGFKMTHNQLKAIHNFIGKLNNSSTRNKVSFFECQKIINSAQTYSK